MTDEEFTEFYWSLTDDERVELNRQLHEFAKENKDIFNMSEESIAEREAKIERYAKVVELNKKAGEIMHKLQTQLDLVSARIEARLLDQIETESGNLDYGKKGRSH